MAGLCLALLLVLAGGVFLNDRLGDDQSTDTPSDRPEPTASTSSRSDLATDLLSSLEDAVSAGDARAAEKLADPADLDARQKLADLVANSVALKVADFSLRFVDEDATASAGLPEGQWAAAVETTWRFDGFDTDAARTEVTFTFTQADDRLTLVDIGGGDRPSPLWMDTLLRVARTATTLVLVDGTQETLTRYARLAEAAVPVVRRVLPQWRTGLVVEVPGSAMVLDTTLGVTPGEYSAIAAVTTAVDGSISDTSPIHVFVNPHVYGKLRDQGGQVVMSHEATHVATDAVRSSTPLWLLEGFADYVALRDIDLPLSVTAGQIADQVRKDGAPAQLPGRAEFDTQTSHLGATYEGAWIACRLLARIGGEDALVELYRRASRGEALDASLQQVFGFGEKGLTSRWRTELETIAG